MDFLETLLLKIKIPTPEVTSHLLQELLSSSKKITQKDETTDKVLDKLWEHLIARLSEFDDQLLCCTCFYTLLIYSENQDKYLLRVSDILNDMILMEENGVIDKDKLVYGMTLMYGLFQSPYLTQKDKQCDKLMGNILEVTFRLLMFKAYEYSQCTFIAFKTISSFKKVVGTDFQSRIFNRNNQIKLLTLINHNWENPITGVRNLNRTVFQILLYVMDKDIYDIIVKDINTFYWNKAKFLMLTEIIEQSQHCIYELLNENNWIDGLMYSLYKPGLVSCGSDMYYAVLKKIKSDEEWCKIFLKYVLTILNSKSHKPIENFYNYWCLITLKKFPTLMGILLDALSQMDNSESKLLSCLSVMKQGNKIALLEEKNEFKDCITQGLVHSNPQIRTRAFDIVCILHGKYFPDRLKYHTILEFLFNNINSDCTVLRINMLNSFSCFLTYLHNAYLMNNEDDNLEELILFCVNLQSLLKTSINFNGNYQRKITTVKLIDLTFKHMNMIPSKKKASRKFTRTLIDMLETKNVWILSDKDFILKLLNLIKDPAEDVRHAVFNVLLNYYTNDLRRPDIFNIMVEDVVKCTESKFFFDIDCGKIIFKLIISIMMRQKETDVRFKQVEDYFTHWNNQLIEEYDLKRNIVDSIEKGKQLHSILGILFVIFETCLEYEYKLNITNDTILALVNILEKNSNQFMFEDDGTVSYDFSKMSELVESLINKSSTTSANEDETKISGLHQVVLNCLWLNVKMSCDISALLIMYNVEDHNICGKCLHIIAHVLETCRHKGAIEAAGAALGKSIQYLTSLPPGNNISKLPFNLLGKKLKQLIYEAQKMASVTRRGAGLSIMIHRIVSSDMKKGKPLFHYFMNVLLNTCMDLKDTAHEENYNSEKDLPKAIYIHFLTKIVTDSSLASEMMFYSAKLAELAFDNLTSPHWQIRNAALQLYGALIPKLIGQKKASGIDEETVATVACDEFRTHSPKLWNFILDQLGKIDHSDVIQNHSNLVPILNILANIARRYNFSYNLEDENDGFSKLLDHLTILLGSPIYTVRRLVSSCIVNLYSFQEIYQLLIEYNNISENSLHGIMLLMEVFFKIYKTLLLEKKGNELKEKYGCLINSGNHSYLSRTIFQNIFPYHGVISNQNIGNVCLEAEKNKYRPGVFIWANIRIKIFIENATWQEILDNLQTLLKFNDLEEHSKYLCKKIEHDCNIPEKLLVNIANTVISTESATNYCGIWHFLYKLSERANLNSLKDSQTFKNQLISPELSYRIRYFIPLASKILSNSGQQCGLLQISNIIYNLSDPSKTDTDMRYIAAIANNEIGATFQNLSDEVKINSIKSAIILLQDEDEEIRNISTIFYHNINNEEINHAFICLSKIVSKEFIDLVLKEPKEGVNIIIKDLEKFIVSMIQTNEDNYNPFANDYKNIYLEENVLRHLLCDLSKNYEE